MEGFVYGTRHEDATFQAIGPIPERSPARHSLSGVPIESADSHICLGDEDFWYDNAPARLKDRVPRVLYREELGFWDTQINGQSLRGGMEAARKVVSDNAIRFFQLD